VVDLDDPDAAPPLLQVVLAVHQGPFQSSRMTGLRGHYVYLQPDGLMLGNGKGILQGPWGEVRGKNGIIVVAPTPHAKADQGGLYQWPRCGEIFAAPTELVLALRGRGKRPARTAVRSQVRTVPVQGNSTPGRGRTVRGRGRALQQLVQEVLIAEQRNNALYSAACAGADLIRLGHVTEAAVVSALSAAGTAVGLSDVEMLGYSGVGGTIYSGLRRTR